MQTRVGLCAVPHTCGRYGIRNTVRSAIGKTVTGWCVAALGNAGHFPSKVGVTNQHGLHKRNSAVWEKLLCPLSLK